MRFSALELGDRAYGTYRPYKAYRSYGAYNFRCKVPKTLQKDKEKGKQNDILRPICGRLQHFAVASAPLNYHLFSKLPDYHPCCRANIE